MTDQSCSRNINRMKNLDLAIINVPLLYPVAPPVGPNIIKACAVNAGFSSDVFDLNLDFCLAYKRKTFVTDQEVFSYQYSGNHSTFFSFAATHNFSSYVSQWIEEVLALNPKTIGLSLFSDQSAYFSHLILHALDKEGFTGNRVIGGPFADIVRKNLDIQEFFGKNFDILAGEAEESIVRYLKGERSGPGINSEPVMLANLDQSPPPMYNRADFDKFDSLNLHKINFYKMGGITGSRGCVRSCSFCDVKAQWPTYRYKSAQKLFSEMTNLWKTYDRKHIVFTDSLINGNMKQIRELSQLLIAHHNGSPPFTWEGQFICRSATSMTPSDYELIRKGGCTKVLIGIESASERVRGHMKKYFSNEDLFFTLEQCHRVGIQVMALMMVGYLNEEEEDFQQTLQFYDTCVEKGWIIPGDTANSTVHKITPGRTLAILPHTPLWNQITEFGKIPINHKDWAIGTNNRSVRLSRLFRMIKHFQKLGIMTHFGSLLGAGYQSLFHEWKNVTQNPEADSSTDWRLVQEIEPLIQEYLVKLDA